MKTLHVASSRLLNQRIAGEPLESPADVVRWMGAVQAQDFAAAKWAVGLRTRACTDTELEKAFAAGEVLRTHVMRPTWHFVAPEDAGWMLMLTGARVEAALAYQYRRLGLDARSLTRSRAAMEKALIGGTQLTRTELRSVLAKAGVHADGLRLAHVVLHAELAGLICSGGRRGKQFTYALLDERAPRPRRLERDEALALLTERYFTSHGPATARDYAWWSGMSSTDIKAGLEMVKRKLVSEELDGQLYWMAPSSPAPRRPRAAVYLLPNYDEYIVGYTDRGAIFDSVHAQHLDARHNPLFNHTLVSHGRIAGTWARTNGKDWLAVSVKPFVAASADAGAIEQAARRFARFVEGGRLEFAMIG